MVVVLRNFGDVVRMGSRARRLQRGGQCRGIPLGVDGGAIAAADETIAQVGHVEVCRGAAVGRPISPDREPLLPGVAAHAGAVVLSSASGDGVGYGWNRLDQRALVIRQGEVYWLHFGAPAGKPLS